MLGLPVLICEFAVGRASQKSISMAYDVLEPKNTKWHYFKWSNMLGNYLLMMFYTTVGGWMMIYFMKMASGEFQHLSNDQVSEVFSSMLASPYLQVGFMTLTKQER